MLARPRPTPPASGVTMLHESHQWRGFDETAVPSTG